MATRRRQPQPELQVKEFTPEELDRGIAKLKRRIQETQGLAEARVRYDDPRREVVTEAIHHTILEVFGPNTLEHRRHGYHRIWDGPEFVSMSDAQLQAGFEAGITHTIAILGGLVARLEEKRADFGQDQTARARATFDGLDLHPRIAMACAGQYRDGYYADAVRNASLALVNFVKEKSGRVELDGSPLMETVFSANNPRLAFNDLADQTDRDEQRGMMFLFAGAVLALRNPRAHRLLQDSPEEALDYIAFLSMLARQVDRAQVR